MTPLVFDSYSEVRMPLGYCLFFPRLIEEQRNPRKPRHKEVERVMIVAADARDGRFMTGVVIGSVLHVDLERKTFFELMRTLDDRDLKRSPQRFDFQLNEDGSLQKLQIDGNWFECSLNGGKSDISELSA